jgi:hypothetical protein
MSTKRGRPPVNPDQVNRKGVTIKVSPMVLAQMRALAEYHGTTVSCLTRRWYLRLIEKNPEFGVLENQSPR